LKRLISLLLALAFLQAGLAGAEPVSVGSVKNIQGRVHIVRGGETVPAEVGSRLYQNDTIVTGEAGTIGVLFKDNSGLSMGPDSRLQITRYVFDPAASQLGFVARVTKGTMVYLSGLIAKLGRDSVRFETTTAVAGVRGTRLAIQVQGD